LATAQAAAVEQIQVPTLLVTGDQDGVAPPAAVALMADRINGSQRVVYDGCGHWTTFEKSKRCLQELKLFHTPLR
jgi:pimeloyl-ACP methyl ester carboxylesterase